MYQPEISLNVLFPGLYMKRRKMTPAQTRTLMEVFQANAFPEKEQIHHLAMSLNITKNKVERWFGNMRHKKVEEGLLKKRE